MSEAGPGPMDEPCSYAERMANELLTASRTSDRRSLDEVIEEVRLRHGMARIIVTTDGLHRWQSVHVDVDQLDGEVTYRSRVQPTPAGVRGL